MTNSADTITLILTPPPFLGAAEHTEYSAELQPPYMEMSVPDDASRRAELRNIADAYEGNVPDPQEGKRPVTPRPVDMWPKTEAGLRILMLGSGWADTNEGRALLEHELAPHWAFDFSEWMVQHYPDPGEVANAMRDWRELGRGDTEGAHKLAGYIATSGSVGLERAFAIIWGKRWDQARSERSLSFFNNPASRAGLVGVSEEIQTARDIKVHRLDAHERMKVGDDQEPVMTADEAYERFGVRAELRGVVYLGHEKHNGNAFGIFDTAHSPRDAAGNIVDLFRKHPRRKIGADTGRLMLLPAELGEVTREEEESGTRSRETVRSVINFDTRPIFLESEKGDVALGRPTLEVRGGLLAELFPLQNVKGVRPKLSGVSNSVSRIHARLQWEGSSWALVNQVPYAHTFVQSADIATERRRQIESLQRYVGAIAAQTHAAS